MDDEMRERIYGKPPLPRYELVAGRGEYPPGPWEAGSDGHIYPEKSLGMGPDSPYGGPPHIARVNGAWNNVGHYSADRIATIIKATPELIGVLKETWNNLQALADALEDGDVSAAELHLRDAFENVKYGLGQVE